MNRIAGAIKATSNFFAGDMIILLAVILAFILGALLVNVAQTPNPVTAVVFVAFIVGGLVVTLRRERGDRPRLR